MKPDPAPIALRVRRATYALALTACCCWSAVANAEEAAKPVEPSAPTQPATTLPAPPMPLPPGLVPPGRPHPVPPKPGTFNPSLPIVQKIGPGLYSLGGIQIDKTARSITLPVKINMNKGLLEYLLVRDGGKTHESLFRTAVDPTQLQVAMLLLGAEGTNQPLSQQGDPDVPKGEPVELTVNYFHDGKIVPVRPEGWVARKDGDTPSASGPLQWVFTGSTVYNGRFMAQASGSIIAIYHDPVALFDNASPGGESDRIWFVNEAAVPPVGTPLTLTIRIKN